MKHRVITRYSNAQPSGGITLPPPVTLDLSPGTGSNSNGFGGNLLGALEPDGSASLPLLTEKETGPVGSVTDRRGGGVT